MMFGKKKTKQNSENMSSVKNHDRTDSCEPILVATIANTVSSEIFQDILKKNGIPFLCRQAGAGGYMKIMFGGSVIPDDIYVAEKNYEKAAELYKVYLETETPLEEQ